MSAAIDVSDKTKFAMPVRNLISLVASVAVGDVVIVTEEPSVPDYENMTKLELEAMMRTHSIELDRRKSKKDLLSQVRKHFNK